MRRRTLTAPDRRDLRLGAWLSEALSLPLVEAEAVIRAGAVYVQGRRVTDPARILAGGAKVSVVLEERGASPTEVAGATRPLEILFEDDEVLAVNKPAGVPAQPTASRVEGNLVSLASDHLRRPAGLVQRLDRETSGVTVFGKTPQATAALAEQFRVGVPRKRYLAVTGPGLPEQGHLDLPLSPDPAHKGRFRASRAANGKDAVTDFERLFGDEVFSLLIARPLTGRTHQIRAHLTGIGFPLAGDALYRGPMRLGEVAIPRCLLHALTLSLKHPRTLAPLELEAPVPPELALWVERAGNPPLGP